MRAIKQRVDQHPLSAAQIKCFQRLNIGVQQPNTANTLAGVDRTLAAKIQLSSQRGKRFTHPVQSLLPVGCGWKHRNSLTSPTCDVGNQNVFPQMQFWCVKNPRAAIRSTPNVCRMIHSFRFLLKCFYLFPKYLLKSFCFLLQPLEMIFPFIIIVN